MKLPRLLFLCILFSPVIYTSCEFKPKGDYFLDLSAKPPSNVLITIQGHSDTILANNSNQYYNVEVVCENHSVLFHRLYIDGVEKYVQNSGNRFYIEPLTYIHKDGIYTMTIEIGINTGSGSIGDALGTEGFLARKDFVLVVLREQITFYPDVKFDRSDNKMKVFMDVPSNVQNIKKVVFSRAVGMSQSVVFASVAGTNHYEADDPQYVGEYASYTVQTYIGDPTGSIFYPFVNGGENAFPDLPVVTVAPSNRGFPLLRWEKTHYAANCGGYRIYAIPSGSLDIQNLGSVSNNNDTVYEAAGTIFPSYYRFHVAAIPAQLPAWFSDQVAWDNYSGEVETYVGLNSFFFYRFLSPDGPFIYYTGSSNDINEYSIETGAITDSITTSTGWFYTFAVSPNGKYLLAATGISDFSYLFYDLTTNQSTWVPSGDVIGAGAETGIISVADNGLVSIITGTRFVVYDFLNQNAVAQQTLPTYGDRTIISADGQFIFVEAGYLYLYKLTSGTLQEKWASSSQPGTFKYYAFEPARPSKARILIDQTMFTKDCETWTTEGSFVPDFDNICNIDFANGHILGKTATHFKVIDLNTGTLQFQNPTETNNITTDLRIKKNTIYYSGGKKLIIF
ncbi:MAG: hypothetical protein NT004_02905 [Bacteroidetes bacterium]|nr:hypothetical protein [Bacteroidota bacterium]